MKTFDLLSEFQTLKEVATDIEVDEITGEVTDNSGLIESLFNDCIDEAGIKLEQLEYIKKELSGTVAVLKEEEARLSKRRKSLENNIDRLKALQISVLHETDNKLKTDKFTFSVRKSKAVVLNPFVEAETLPDEYKTIKTTVTPNKKALKEAIENGVVIDGVEIVENESVAVK